MRRFLPVFVGAIGLLFSSVAVAEPMPAPTPPRAPRIQLPRGGVLAQQYTPRDDDTQPVIVVDAAKEQALVAWLSETLRLAYDQLTSGNLLVARDIVKGGLYRFEQVVGSAVARFANGRALLEADAYLALALREPDEARRLCAAKIRRLTLAWKTCEALAPSHE
jgi:hypothetical protein